MAAKRKRKRRKVLYGGGPKTKRLIKRHQTALQELQAHMKKIAKDPEWGAQHTKKRKVASDQARWANDKSRDSY